MTILPFRAPDSDKRAQLEQLAGELGALVIWPGEWQPLSDSEAVVLAKLDSRYEKKPLLLAEQCHLAEGTVQHILTRLRKQGRAIRRGHYHRGGWVRVEPELAAAA
jgi:hypothetical protein